jgi:hypothetical protein
VHLARRGKDALDAPADEAGAARSALTSGIAAESIIDVMESCLKAGVGRAITDRCGHRSPAKSSAKALLSNYGRHDSKVTNWFVFFRNRQKLFLTF